MVASRSCDHGGVGTVDASNDDSGTEGIGSGVSNGLAIPADVDRSGNAAESGLGAALGDRQAGWFRNVAGTLVTEEPTAGSYGNEDDQCGRDKRQTEGR